MKLFCDPTITGLTTCKDIQQQGLQGFLVRAWNVPQHLKCKLISKYTIQLMLEAINNVSSIAQPIGLRLEQPKHIPRGCWYDHETSWRPCLIIASPTGKNAVDTVLVNWK